MALTWMLCGASSIAIDLVSCTTPPLAAAYEGARLNPKNENMLPMLMILPRLRSTMPFAASFDSRKTALSCVSMTRSQSSGFSCSTPPLMIPMPALFTSMSTPPSELSTAVIAGASAARSVTSTTSASAGFPIASSSPSTASFLPGVTPQDRDSRAGLRQRECDAAPDSPIAASDERDADSG